MTVAWTLLEKGCDYVLITGSHEDTPSVSNQLFHDRRCWETYTWDRLPVSYHGSGCTLASSIAALIAHGLEPVASRHGSSGIHLEFIKYRLSTGQRPARSQSIFLGGGR